MHARIDLLLPQAREEEVGERVGGNDHDAVPALQTCLHVLRDGVGEGPRVGV